MSGISGVSSNTATYQIAAQKAAVNATSSKSAEEQKESPAQQATEHEGGGLDVSA